MERLWHDIVVSSETTSYIANTGITWRFIVESTPWWGGFYERLVSMVKRTLVKAVGKSKLTTIQLTTVLTEIEAILNSRPLTYVYSENDAGRPLTPKCFLLSSCTGIPTAKLDLDPDFRNVPTTSLIAKLNYTQRILDIFWTIWKDEYLSHLREYHQHWKKSLKSCTRIPSIEDVVLVKEDGTKRGHWKLGVIQQVYHGSDNNIRPAQVKCNILQRPVSKFYPLELNASVSATDPTKKDHSRPQRQAADKANLRIKECLKAEKDE